MCRGYVFCVRNGVFWGEGQNRYISWVSEGLLTWVASVKLEEGTWMTILLFYSELSHKETNYYKSDRIDNWFMMAIATVVCMKNPDNDMCSIPNDILVSLTYYVSALLCPFLVTWYWQSLVYDEGMHSQVKTELDRPTLWLPYLWVRALGSRKLWENNIRSIPSTRN